jgi:hypothetical protein
LQQLDCEVGTDPSEPGFSEPVQTCTWFHNGQEINRSRDDYFSADVDACPLGETLFSRYHPKGEIDEPVTPEDADSRYRIAQALVGSVARTEISPYRADAQAPSAAALYSVEEKRYLVREVRPQGLYAAAVLLPLQVEAISYQYDGFINDPLCRHDVTLRWNAYGAAAHALTVSYARRLTAQSPPPFTEDHLNQWWSDAHDEAQQYFYISETRARLINLPEPQQWRLGLPYLERGNALKLAKGTLPGELNPARVSFESLRELQDTQEWAMERVLTSQSIQRYVDVEGIELDDGVAGFEALSHSLELALLDKTALDAYSIVPDLNIREALAAIGYSPMALLFEAPPSEEPNLWSSRFNLARYGDLQAFYNVLDFNETPSHGVTKAEYDQHHLTVMRMELPDGCAVQVADAFTDAPACLRRLLTFFDEQLTILTHHISQPRIDLLLGLQDPTKAVDAGFDDLDLRLHGVVGIAVSAEHYGVNRFSVSQFNGREQLLVFRRRAGISRKPATCAGTDMPAGQQVTLLDRAALKCGGGYQAHPAEKVFVQSARCVSYGIFRKLNGVFRTGIRQGPVIGQLVESGRFAVLGTVKADDQRLTGRLVDDFFSVVIGVGDSLGFQGVIIELRIQQQRSAAAPIPAVFRQHPPLRQ